MRRRRLCLLAIISFAIAGSGLTGCEQWGSTQQQIDYQQCRWDVGCQNRCAQGVEGLKPYCGRD
ncbi:MAG TPA: hypothetical protein VK433_09080 [Stellaceae bacterium]|nr:hypothetical protein [Stellaceae bacterium]